ncbi:MAG: hypothetical protein A2X64_08635 [Ignavibacteria bacterium GWF2_33_9]|nr:MAG: hypothetical protein A2X64_08635 [Ignavibacteria bacterium GWF2_33_9]
MYIIEVYISLKNMANIKYILLFFAGLLIACKDDPVGPEKTAYPEFHSITPYEAYYGDTITITGKNFGKMTDSNNIHIIGLHSTKISPITWQNDKIQFINPIQPTTGDISLGISFWIGDSSISTNSQINLFSAILPPVIDSLSKFTSAIGHEVTVYGKNFGNYSDSLQVIFGTKIIKELSVKLQNKITFAIPDNSISGKIQVQRRYKLSNETSLKIIQSPKINSISNDFGISGDLIELYGENFGDLQSNAKVFFGDLPAEIIIFSSQVITVKVPNIPNCTNIRVEVEKVPSNEIYFKTANCLTLADMQKFHHLRMEEYVNGNLSREYFDTLKPAENDAFTFISSHKFDYDEQSYSIIMKFDEKTMSMQKSEIVFSYFHVDWSHIQTKTTNGYIFRIYNNIPLANNFGDSLFYIFDNTKGTSYYFREHIKWQNTKEGTSGEYDNNGEYSISAMPEYRISLLP